MRLTPVAFLFCVSVVFATGAQVRDGVKVLPVIDKQDIHFFTIFASEGALKKIVRGITRDNQGFMWFATDDGLFRYDGYSLTPFLHDPANPSSISSDNIYAIYKDRSGMLWIATVFDGLDRLDPARGVLTHYRHHPGVENSLISDRTKWIYQDRRGTLWVGTDDGLDRFNPSNGTFVHYTHDPGDPASLSSNEIVVVYEGRDDNLWVGTTHGLNKLDRVTGKWEHFLHDPNNPHSLGHNYVSSIVEDRSGVLWVGSTLGEGLSSLDVKTGTFTRYSYHPEPIGDELLEGVDTLHEDADGFLWLGTEQNGLLKLDPERKEFSRYVNDPANPFSLGNNIVPSIFEDPEGGIWLGTEGGVSRFPRKSPEFVNYRREAKQLQGLRSNDIWSVRGDSRGDVWIGTPSGLQMFDPKTRKFTLYQHDPQNSSSISDGQVSAIREDASGNLWIGVYGGGLNWLDRAAGRFTHYRPDPKKSGSLSSDLINCLLLDREGTLWVGTQFGGIDRYDRSTGKFKNYHYDTGNPNSLSNNNVRALFEDRAGTLWVGTIGGGLDRFDRKSEKFTSYRYDPKNPASLSSDAVDAIYQDGQGTLWIGTRQGLDRLDSSGTFTKFSMKDGLPDAYVGGILEDRHGDLWLGTYNGLSHFSPQTNRFRNYSQIDGLPGNRLDPHGREAAAQLPDGEMVFGSTDGFLVFDPDRLSTNSYVPPVVLTDFQLFNKPVSIGGNSPLQAPIWATNALTLNHDQSIVTLEFATLSYEAPEKNRYRYRLDNYEKDWNEVDSSRRRTTYTNLPPGHYVFRVQGSNNDQLWNESGVSLAITVLPPWYETWTFRAAVTICIAALIGAAFRLRVRSLQLTAARLERQVADRTVELKAAKESAENANRSKSVFLSHMSHELRTPLNAILGFANLLREDGVSEKQRADLEIIHRSGEHLLGLINDVLDIAKVEAGREKAEIAPCDLGRLIRDVTGMMRPRAAEKNLELRFVQPPEFPQFVETDAKKLRQMLINLLGNAIKYTERGSVTLRVKAQSASGQPAGDPEHVLLSFEVQDTGIGIAPEDQGRIFEPFVQVGNSLRQKGTGLGLAITRQFAVLLGGGIGVTSTRGEGSLFRLEIPVLRAEPVVEDSVAAEREYILSPDQPEYRILVVDDALENRQLLDRLLRHAGFQVRLAEDGPQAVEMFQSWRPQFIWMDLRMPGVDGAEATRRIRALDEGREVKIVAVTASEDTKVPSEGMDDLVHKPYRPHEIFDCMARHLGVRYRSDDAGPAPPVEPPAILRPEALAALPAGLCSELGKAVLILNINQIDDVIARISEVDTKLGAALKFHAERLAFTEVLEVVKECSKVAS